MIHKTQKTHKTPGRCCVSLVIISVGIIVISIILANPNIIPYDEPKPTTFDVNVKFNYAYPDRYTFEKNTTELLQEPVLEFGSIKYQFNVTIEGHYWRSTTRITPSVLSPTMIKLQFYKVNMPYASDSFIDVAGMLTVTMNSTLIMLDVLRIVAHSFILNDPNDYWSCEMSIEALDYLTP